VVKGDRPLVLARASVRECHLSGRGQLPAHQGIMREMGEQVIDQHRVLRSFAAAAAGVLPAIARARRVAVTAVGAGLGLFTLGYWFWVLQGILDTT
jgi:hypothetical protein